ncbi:MAG: hypothetical protein QXQ64_02460 [Candidatus Bathyarchaeia archaeon]|uniref:hypothetical protein n=1 Tax=Candidatus Hadarchaeum sp. TaxID=2883567 RepID=UPI003172D133
MNNGTLQIQWVLTAIGAFSAISGLLIKIGDFLIKRRGCSKFRKLIEEHRCLMKEEEKEVKKAFTPIVSAVNELGAFPEDANLSLSPSIDNSLQEFYEHVGKLYSMAKIHKIMLCDYGKNCLNFVDKSLFKRKLHELDDIIKRYTDPQEVRNLIENQSLKEKMISYGINEPAYYKIISAVKKIPSDEFYSSHYVRNFTAQLREIYEAGRPYDF